MALKQTLYPVWGLFVTLTPCFVTYNQTIPEEVFIDTKELLPIWMNVWLLNTIFAYIPACVNFLPSDASG